MRAWLLRGRSGANVRLGSSSHGSQPPCMLAVAHRWRTADSAGCSQQAQAFERDDSGNCIPQPPRPRALQLREAASAITSKCPLSRNCGHSIATGWQPAPCQCVCGLPGRPAPGHRASLGAAFPWRCPRRRSRSVAAALRDLLAPGRHLGPGRQSRTQLCVQHAGGRVVTEPGAPEMPWAGRTRPRRTHGPARGSSRLLGRDKPYWPR